jgi:hypothetical protein
MSPALDPSSGPGFWRNETGGALVPAMEAYLRGDVLNVRQVALIRAYLRQWIASPIWDENPAADVKAKLALAELRFLVCNIQSQSAISIWLRRAIDMGINPL